MAGTLYVCGTPIGNLEDITLRVLRVLREADVVAAEDTRVTRRLLTHFDIHAPRLVSFREDNQDQSGPALLEALEAGSRVALATDAGMPGISDPGAWLVARCNERGVPVEVIPGPAAPLMALVASGFPANRFVFEGFLPRSGPHRKQRLQALENETRTAVLFEAPHRVLRTLEDLQPHLADRRVCATRELTKKFEEVRTGQVPDLIRHFSATEPRGEFTLVLEGRPVAEGAPDTASLEEFLTLRKAAGARAKEAAADAASVLGVSRQEAYRRFIDLP